MASATEQPRWTATQAYAMAAICLGIGLVVGFLVRGPAGVAPRNAGADPMVSGAAMATTTPGVAAPPPSSPQSSAAEMKAASAQAASTVLERLKSDPKDFKLLVEAGEMYYHHAAYAEAAAYYERALAVQSNVAVRNQYASALYYQGDADRALQEYAKVLRSSPTNDIALFNSGMIKLTTKHDGKAAVAYWQKLLQAYPNHPQRERVQAMIERASHTQD